MTKATIVTVVIPAYNAEFTINETLLSVRSQTHAALEIVVVDDGSTDGTLKIASEHAARDKRVEVVAQTNSGVAAARNRGWKRASSDFIAFIDADDVWAPIKLERQLAAMEECGEEVGLVYSRHARINERRWILYRQSGGIFNGDVLDQLLVDNFIGNGSAALVRRQALVHVGGFDPRLHAAGAQGCEDYLFYLRVAERYLFRSVPTFDVGYRALDDNMSSDLVRMLRSWNLVADEMDKRHPDRAALISSGLRSYCRWLFGRAIQSNRSHLIGEMLLTLVALRRKRVAVALLGEAFLLDLKRRTKRLIPRNTRAEPPSVGDQFEIGTPCGMVE